MIKTIEFKEKEYPLFQSQGFAAKFCFPFALEVCNGIGFDIGANRVEWSLPGSIPVDPAIDDRFDAFRLPDQMADFIFSSHCLEHLPDWVGALNHWRERLKSGGTLFLYLPHPDQEYWLPWNNRKHVNILYPNDIENYLKNNGYKNIFVSERDLNHSYCVMAEKI